MCLLISNEEEYCNVTVRDIILHIYNYSLLIKKNYVNNVIKCILLIIHITLL